MTHYPFAVFLDVSQLPAFYLPSTSAPLPSSENLSE
jgi:hypothetical protein